jgi:hypothetical protein
MLDSGKWFQYYYSVNETVKARSSYGNVRQARCHARIIGPYHR